MADNNPTIDKYGNKRWYQDGKLHRTDGPAAENANGDKFWYQNGKRHRTDGPAIELASGTKFWYQNGECHRTDGPAGEWGDGDKEWYINGKEYSFKDWLQLCSISHEEKCELVLIYS